MWEIKKFKTAESMKKWIDANSNKYQISEIAINNGWAVEFRKLVKPRMPR